VKLLLDTCTFLWLLLEDAAVPDAVWAMVRDPSNELYLSVASAWEIATKYKLGRLALPEPPARFVPKYREANQIASLPLEEEAALQVYKLPDLHADPFDRILVSQAILHSLVIVTPDELIRQYPVRTAW